MIVGATLLASHFASGYHVGGVAFSVPLLRVQQPAVAMTPPEAPGGKNPLFHLFEATKANAQKAVDDAKKKLQDELKGLPDNDAWKRDPKAAFEAMAVAESGMPAPALEKAEADTTVAAVPPDVSEQE